MKPDTVKGKTLKGGKEKRNSAGSFLGSKQYSVYIRHTDGDEKIGRRRYDTIASIFLILFRLVWMVRRQRVLVS